MQLQMKVFFFNYLHLKLLRLFISVIVFSCFAELKKYFFFFNVSISLFHIKFGKKYNYKEELKKYPNLKLLT